MGIVVIGTVFVDIKGFPDDLYNPTGRNAGRVETVHGAWGATWRRTSPTWSCGPPW